MNALKIIRSISKRSGKALLRAPKYGNKDSQFLNDFGGTKLSKRSFAILALQQYSYSILQSELGKWVSILAVSGGLVWLWREWAEKDGYEVLAEKKDDSEALEEEEGYKRVIEAAKSGNPEAQYDYAVMLWRGEGVKQDFEEAIKWFEKAATGGVKEAMYNLGVLYVSGHRVKKQVLKGLDWLERASKAGCPEASLRLANMYNRGDEVSVSATHAYPFYEHAAAFGVREAQHQCGVMKALGRGTATDEVGAFRYFLQAAEQGHVTAACNLGMMYHNGIGVQRDLGKAFYWYREAAQGEDLDATAALALFHLYGLPEDASVTTPIPTNIPLALELLQKAATSSSTAQRILGALYLARGEYPQQTEISQLLPQSRSLAYEMFARCARSEDNDCRSELASMIINGEGVDPKHSDLQLAFKLISKAASEGHPNSLLKKGILQHNGIGTLPNLTAAASSYSKACKASQPAAHFLFGLALINGDGVEKSYTAGISHLRTASGLGFPHAEACVYHLTNDQPLDVDLSSIRRSLLFEPEAPVRL
jgi:hypothetical protein